jgi:hypothetical protein
MSFLRGKSTSYTRFVIPDGMTLNMLAAAVQLRAFADVQDGATQAFGFCSWRNLLDSPIDSGLLGTSPMWLAGLRKDTKKAPSALVQAEVARACADARTVNPTGFGPVQAKALKIEITDKLNKKAQARPAHAGMAVDTSRGLAYVDGLASSHSDVASWLDLGVSIYSDSNLNARYLAWCAWRASNGVDTPCSPLGDIAFREPRDAGATYDNNSDLDGLLEHWLKDQGAKVCSVRLCWGVSYVNESYALETNFNVDLTLQSAGLKVCGLEFPEEIQKLKGDIEIKMEIKLDFVRAFEEALAKDFADFAEAILGNTLPTEFVELVGLDKDAK